MTELNIIELINQKTLEFGNERFLEGWNGCEERIIKLIDEFIENSDYPEVVDSLQWLQDVINGEQK